MDTITFFIVADRYFICYLPPPQNHNLLLPCSISLFLLWLKKRQSPKLKALLQNLRTIIFHFSTKIELATQGRNVVWGVQDIEDIIKRHEETLNLAEHDKTTDIYDNFAENPHVCHRTI